MLALLLAPAALAAQVTVDFYIPDSALTILTNRFHDGHRILEAALSAGRTVDVAVSIGVDPAVFVSAFWPVAPDIEEFAVAGALVGAPLLLQYRPIVLEKGDTKSL